MSSDGSDTWSILVVAAKVGSRRMRYPRATDVRSFEERYGMNAITLRGLPEPSWSWSGPSTRVAPVAGISFRFAMHSIAILWAFAICVFVA